MAKSRPAPDTPDRTSQGSPSLVLVVGAILVIALVAFSLRRSIGTPTATPVPAADAAPPLTTATPPSQTPTQASAQATDPADPPSISPRASAAISIAPPIPGPADAAPTNAQLASVPRIAADDLLQKLEAKQVTVIDVRDAESYRARHIPGALHIPLSYLAGEVPYLPRDKPIVTYCT